MDEVTVVSFYPLHCNLFPFSKTIYSHFQAFYSLVFYNTAGSFALFQLYSYSIEDIKQTLGASGGVSLMSVSIFVVLISIVIAALFTLCHRIKLTRFQAISLPVLALLFLVLEVKELIGKPGLKSDFESNLVQNKSDYFFSATYAHFFPEQFEVDIYDDNYIGYSGGTESNNINFEYVDDINYPFLHKDASIDVFSPFFQAKETPPNIVIILLEGLGRAYSNEGAYLGSFTPFIDSISEKSLTWNNLLSQGGRTFAVLPSILGSLPFGKNGFLDLEKMPEQLSLLNLLKFNGYQTSFYYGGNSDFDRMRQFLKLNKVDEIRDEKTFPAGFVKLPSVNGFSWGYNDKELFRYYLSSRSDLPNSKPQLSVILTVSSHNPFKINESDEYAKILESRFNFL